MKTVYSFSAKTGEYLGLDTAQESPREPGNFLMPANSTSVEPPAVGANQVAVFNGTVWTVEDDWRGTVGYDSNDNQVVISQIGETLESLGLSVEAPTPDPRIALVANAQAALTASDRVIIRCSEHGVQVPAAWLSFRSALRAIISGADTSSTALPVAPVYPAGT